MFNATKYPGTYTRNGVTKTHGVRNRDKRHAMRVLGITDDNQLVTGLEQGAHKAIATFTMPAGAIAPHVSGTPATIQGQRNFAHGTENARIKGIYSITGPRPCIRKHIDKPTDLQLFALGIKHWSVNQE